MIWLCLLAFLLPRPQERPDFELTYLAVHGRRQETVAFDFSGDGRTDILNTAIDYDADPPIRWFFLHLQTKDRNFREKPDFVWKISDRAVALLYGDFVPGNGIEIAFAAPDGIYYYPWKDGAPDETPHKLLHLRTFFSEPSPRAIPAWWMPLDLDGNSLHDILIPVPGGYRIYFQTRPGIYGRISELEADLSNPADRALAAARYATSNDFIASLFGAMSELPRVAVADVDGDKHLDLVSIEGEILTIFFQRRAGRFLSRRGHRVRFPVAALREKEKKDTVSLSLVDLPDLDGDGLTDLVVTKIEGTLGFLESIKTNIYVHRGTGRGNFVADTVIRIDGVSIDPAFLDMNNDGTVDCLVSRLRTDILAQAIKAAVLGDIAITYEVFQFEKMTGKYVETPVYTRDVYVTTNDITKKGAASVPMVYVLGDHSGDGRPDMVVVNPEKTQLELHRGVDSHYGSRRFISYRSTPFWKKRLSRYPNGVIVHDVNDDGTQDVLLMHHGTLGVVLSTKKR